MDHHPFTTQISMFSQPLFSSKMNLHLGNSDGLKGNDGVIDIKGRKPVIVAEELVEKVSPYVEAVLQRDSFDHFVDRIEKDALYRNTRIGYDYGLALILQKEYQAAAACLREVANSEWERRVVPDEVETADRLVTLLDLTPEDALNLVHGYMANNKSNLAKYLND